MGAVAAKTKSLSSSKAQRSCCVAIAHEDNPDHSAEINRIRRIQGQLDGVIKMITDRRYCPDILVQTRAASSAIKSLDGAILQKHLDSCLKKASSKKDPKEWNRLVKEIGEIFSSLPR